MTSWFKIDISFLIAVLWRVKNITCFNFVQKQSQQNVPNKKEERFIHGHDNIGN